MDRTPFHHTLLLLFAVHLALCASATQKVLVLLEEPSGSYPKYDWLLSQLEEKGYGVEIEQASERGLGKLVQLGELAYQHLVLLAPQLQVEEAPKELVNFVDHGGNVLVAMDSNISKVQRTFAKQFGVEFDKSGSFVIDHFNCDKSSLDHQPANGENVVYTNHILNNTRFFSEDILATTNPILFSGIAQRINLRLPLLTTLLSASETAYSSFVGGGGEVEQDHLDDNLIDSLDDPFASGKNIALVSAHQSLNNARVVFAGSVDMFSDKFVNLKMADGDRRYGNKDFISELVDWVFQAKSVIRVTATSHHRTGESESREWYTVNDEISYSIDFSEYGDGRWRPFNARDVQLELVMLDPYIRLTLPKLPSKGEEKHSSTYGATFRLPDVFGLFTFKVDYKRPGLSYVLDQKVVPIHQLGRNQHPRLLVSNYPHYAAAASMLVGLLVFTAVWLFNRDTSGGNRTKKDQ